MVNVIMDVPLQERLSAYLPEEKIEDVLKAYRFAEQSHKGQLRLSGEPFFEHPKPVSYTHLTLPTKA